MVKNPPANAGDSGSIPGSGRSPGVGHGNSLQYSCLENPMVGYHPWGHKESDTVETTEHASSQEQMFVCWAPSLS